MFNGASLPVVGMVSGQGDNHLCRVPAGPGELCCRYGVQVNPYSSRVEAPSRGVLIPSKSIGSMPSGLVCHAAKPSVNQVCHLEAGPVCSSIGCVPTQLERSTRLLISSLCAHRQMRLEDTGGEEHGGASDRPVGSTNVVPSFTGSGGGLPIGSIKEGGPSEGSSQQATSPGKPGETSANRLESVRGQLAAAGVSGQAADLLVAGWSQGTNSTYKSAWRQWLCWCGAKQVDLISCGIHPF